LIATILRSQGFWVHPRFKVELSKQEKRKIGLPSAPRWELDIVAYKGATNELLVVECKSYLDSPGVTHGAFLPNGKLRERYKLFTNKKIRNAVLRKLGVQLVEKGYCAAAPRVQLALAAGKVAKPNDNRVRLKQHFLKHRWLLFDEDWLHQQLALLAKLGYEDDLGVLVAKMFLKPSSASFRSPTTDSKP
jgi:hypothetical protein